jgi:uncharacterized protein YkwD
MAMAIHHVYDQLFMPALVLALACGTLLVPTDAPAVDPVGVVAVVPAGVPAENQPATTGYQTSPAEERLAALVNLARDRHALPRLRLRATLSAYAHHHSRQMATANLLFHTTDFDVICCWRWIAENIGFAPDVLTVHRAFMDSDDHRANVLDPTMRGLGIGVVSDGLRIWATEIFRDPR